MKPYIISALLFLWAGVSFSPAQPTIYGNTGTFFVPDGFVSEGGPFGASVSHDLTHISAFGVFLNNRLEVAVSNTYAMLDDVEGFEARKVPLPIVPSVKYYIFNSELGRHKWGYSAGAASPYGGYLAASLSSRFPILQPRVTAGISLTGKKSYALGSLVMTLANTQGHPLPLSFVADAAWASSTQFLGEVEEGFYSIGGRLSLNRSLRVEFFFRDDPVTYMQIPDEDNPGIKIEKPGQNTGKFYIRLAAEFSRLTKSFTKEYEGSK
jgi:hypothetical protein